MIAAFVVNIIKDFDFSQNLPKNTIIGDFHWQALST
jgi:hypothetical protein